MMTDSGLPLLDYIERQPKRFGSDFDGVTFEPSRDGKRLNAQLSRTYEAMKDGQWHTPDELETLTGDRWASLSARLRDLRKTKFLGATIERESRGNGLFAYRLVAKS